MIVYRDYSLRKRIETSEKVNATLEALNRTTKSNAFSREEKKIPEHAPKL